MVKKILYWIILVVALVLGYLNYFGEDNEIKEISHDIETTNVEYMSDGYKVLALKQKDNLKTKETYFEKATAYVKDMVLSGDNVQITKDKDIILEHNIRGTNGSWKFESESLKYTREEDKISSVTGVKAINDERKLEISSDEFYSNSKFSRIELKKNIQIKNENIFLNGEKGYYDDLKKVAIIEENGRFRQENKDSEMVSGVFDKMIYTLNNGVLRSNSPYLLNYGNTKIKGEKLIYNTNDESFVVDKNVVISIDDYNFDVNSLKREANSDKIDIYGIITGGNDEYYFEGDKGEYIISEKKLYITGDLKIVTKNGERMYGDGAEFDYTKKQIKIMAKNNVVVENKDGKLTTGTLYYDTENKTLLTEEKYQYKGIKYDSYGDNICYNRDNGQLEIFNGKLVDKILKRDVSGEKIKYNEQSKDLEVSGSAKVESPEYIFKGNEINYKEEERTYYVLGDYTVELKDSKTKLLGKNAKYNVDNYQLTSEGEIKILGDKFVAISKDLEYNSQKKIGYTKDKVNFENFEKNVKITGDKFSFDLDKNMVLEGNVVVTSDKIAIESPKAIYNLENKEVIFPEKVEFKTKDNKNYGKVQNGRYFVEKEIFNGYKFTGNNEKNSLKSDEVLVYVVKNLVELKDNIEITNNETKISGKKANYNLEESKVEFLDKYIIKYGKFSYTGDKGEYFNKKKLLKGENIEIISENGDVFNADYMESYLDKLVVDFKGNVRGKIDDNGVMTQFFGDGVRLYFKNENGHELSRSEIKGDAIFIQEDKKLYSDYIEVDNNKKTIFSKGDSKVTLKNKNEDITVKAEYLEFDSTTKKLYLNRNINITTVDEMGKKILIQGEYGEIEQEKGKVKIEKNVVINRENSDIKADKVLYDMNTKKMKALGNVVINYEKE